MLAERRCFCNNCKTEFRFPAGAWDDENCPVCGNNAPDYELIGIPDYETPAQYEKRTGEAYPHNAPVWWKYADSNKKWRTQSYSYAKRQSTVNNILIIIADSPFPPPVDWKPEEITP